MLRTENAAWPPRVQSAGRRKALCGTRDVHHVSDGRDAGSGCIP